MPRHNFSARNISSVKGQARRSIASLAARMMAEDGIADYAFAKRKAAKALGVGDGEPLPANEEIEAELRTYQSLFQDGEQQERLRELREIALDVMELLADFRPYLTGAVLDGTAGRYSDIEIDIHADSAKEVEISLLARGIDYASSEPRRHGRPRNSDLSPETCLHIEWREIPVTLSIHSLTDERQQRRDASNRPTRARASAVAALLAQSAA